MIKILSKRGKNHGLNSEDNYFVHENDDIIVGAVFDGCSSGERSHWASETFKILFEKSTAFFLSFKDLSDREKINEEINFFLIFFCSELKSLMNFLQLDLYSFLSTIVFFVYDKKDKHFYYKFIGDGSVFFKKEGEDQYNEHSNDEDNMPDYIAYCLSGYSISEIEDKIKSKPIFYWDKINSFIISTDGIDSFVNINPNYNYENISNAKEYLINTSLFEPQRSELGKKFNLLVKDDWHPYDDVTLIKYISDEA